MTNTFLREVRLRDFRTFGEFTLAVPPGPGLTLLVGTNGLGKSSFFDGIEWCLTGNIRRFQDYIGRLKESDYLTRRDAQAGVHQVSLTFTEGGPLVRTLREHPAADALLDLLKNPEWTEINDIGAYLGFTHFLGQASQQRFTSRAQSDQWQALKGPSGIDRIESIRTALRGRATTLAFGRRAEREEGALNAAMRALEEWQGYTARLAGLQARGVAAGAENEAALEARLSNIERVMPAGEHTSEDFAERLSIARATIEAEQQQIARNRVVFDTLRITVARFAEASALLGREGARLDAADGAIATATTHVSEAMLAATNAESAAAAQAEIVARIEAEHRERVRIRTAIAEFGTLDAERRAAQADEAVLKAEHDTCQADVTSARGVLSRAHEAQATLSRLDSEQATLQLWSTRAAALQAKEAASQIQRKAATAAAAAADRARNQLTELQRAFDDARAVEANADARLAARRRDASQLAELLSGIAAHINHDATQCPVCANSFPVGELQTRARNAVAAQDAQLADDVRALDALRDRTKAVAQALAQARSLMSAEVEATAAAVAAETVTASERAAIAEGLGVSPENDLVSLINERLSEAARARAAHIRDAGGSAADVSSAQARVDALSATLASLDERRASAVQRRTRCETMLRSIEESLEGHPRPLSTEAADAAIETQRKLLEDARTSLEELTVKRVATANSETVARERLAAAQAERERIASAIRDAEAGRAAAVEAWQQAGMDGEPSSQAIEAREAALGDLASALAVHFEDTNALSRSYESFLAQDELRALLAKMDQHGGEGAAENPALYAQQLQGQLEAARAALRLTTATREAVVAYGDQLKAEAESFSTQFLLPLNDLIDGFNRALLSAPGATVQFTAEHTVERTSLAMQLRYADAVDNAQYRTTLPPQLVLSEGQMAANGFSILCAASTAYPWSRWRALLLDDPLQHNDIIHTAAFVDVMRNLVELEGYQLIMSSHKRDEGEFIARKFDAAGLPCTVVELVGASRDGVRVAPPRHNAAARHLLARPEARMA
ncbi:AAA family ATPase [Paraburkholderia silvatlantica]|uniref:Rad50/SbcC-type AAA domain-containing protein n=1 Tax=Paraburkholderia silvatlantica TaxID=321895 RepID=A0ABR6FX98_9BURK|nr:AAA family ATPase [Paraburkholderia silvatlantica]MBB2932059.1 hypothetical protein [Paraburkholderia silvatlantica]PVY24734.1 DNA repair exonuclease SbcCD ATPase subunit [Paraburkholderia silvatlantica]PXW31230.1 DNA repair exonuclease SbcCD ATPase subunit [Paraburkholderia silvatlantica]